MGRNTHFERALRRHGRQSTLRQRIDRAVTDLNEDRPRPVLGGRTARQAYERGAAPLSDRDTFIEKVDRTERMLHDTATTRAQGDSARRRAVERVLLDYGLMKNTADASHNFVADQQTN